jgi:3-oxoadipate enol-lactonase
MSDPGTGVFLNVSLAGDRRAPALILAHPLGANLHVWDAVAPALAEKFFVIGFDARGHGRSPCPEGPYVLADLGADVLALMDGLGLASAHFLGQSMGGAVGQWLMIHAPERLEKVVLANTASHFPGPAGWNARIRSARDKGMAELAPAVAQRWLTADFRKTQPKVAAEIEDMLRASDPLGYAACCSALRDADLRDAIRAAPPRPVLVIVGESDASTPPNLGADLANSLKDARLARLQAAHLSSVEAENAFVEAALGFLAGEA